MIVRALAMLLMLACIPALEGCYYLQAAKGQMEIMHRRRPVDDVIRDSDSSDELRRQLALVKQARQFSIDVLLLPDNGSYRSYADLERDFVVWNVFAAPEFSLQPRQWCYPVAGCVSYRGYFSQRAAARQAKKLRRKGLDVLVGGVRAYSTLGRFSDPVLSTMMRWSDIELVAVLFHELAHQLLYVKDDTVFNESFASAVEEFGVERWLETRGELERLDEYRSSRAFRTRLMELVESARTELTSLYESQADDDAKRERKQEIFAELKVDTEWEARQAGRGEPGWLSLPLNNASLIPLMLYQGRLDEFRSLLAGCDEDLQCFYAKAEALSQQDAS